MYCEYVTFDIKWELGCPFLGACCRKHWWERSQNFMDIGRCRGKQDVSYVSNIPKGALTSWVAAYSLSKLCDRYIFFKEYVSRHILARCRYLLSPLSLFYALAYPQRAPPALFNLFEKLAGSFTTGIGISEMSTDRIFDPANMGILSRLPLEIRQEVYDHMCAIDSAVYELEVEGYDNIHIPSKTVELFQNQRLPRIAHVCAEMRDYALGSARTPISFTFYVFGTEFHQTHRIESFIERKVIQSFFRFKSDRLSFKPHEMIKVEELDFGEGDYYDFILRNEEAMARVRINLFVGSGNLPSSNPTGYTKFEEFVRLNRDGYVMDHPLSATAQRVTRTFSGENSERHLIESVTDRMLCYSPVQRSYYLGEL